MPHAFVSATILAGLCSGKPTKGNTFLALVRYSFGVTAARAGLTLLEIRNLLGHSATGVTRRYAQYAPDEDRAKHQAAAIGRLLTTEKSETQQTPKPQLSRTDGR